MLLAKELIYFHEFQFASYLTCTTTINGQEFSKCFILERTGFIEIIQKSLAAVGIDSELILIKSDGEHNLKTPLYEMGVQGIFTRALDIALLNDRIDIAVHSLKDVPTKIAQGLTLAAVPKRGNHKDVLVYKNRTPEIEASYLVATSSLRRSAQWLHRYTDHETTVLRGNINTRLNKLQSNLNWDGALFAAAGIERIDLEVPNRMDLDWMIPAPSQGALGVVVRESDSEILSICEELDDTESRLATSIERMFLGKLMGGCSMPIGALAYIIGEQIEFTGCVLTLDGKDMSKVEVSGSKDRVNDLVDEAVGTLLDRGGADIVETYRN